METFLPEQLYVVNGYEINVLDDSTIQIVREKGLLDVNIDECICDILNYSFNTKKDIINIISKYGFLHDIERDLKILKKEYLLCKTAIRLLEFYETRDYYALLDKINIFYYLYYFTDSKLNNTAIDDSYSFEDSVNSIKYRYEIQSPFIEYFNLYYKDLEYSEDGIFKSHLPFMIDFDNLVLVYDPRYKLDIEKLDSKQKNSILSTSLHMFNNWIDPIKTKLISQYDGKNINIWSTTVTLIDAIKNRVVLSLENCYYYKKCSNQTCLNYYWAKKGNIRKLYCSTKCCNVQAKRDQRARDGHPFKRTILNDTRRL